MTTAHKGSVLIVDDDALSRTMLSANLQDQGHTVETAEDGPQALKIIQTRPFDLVLLDILMPGMDGFQVCQQLKADKNTRDIPIILISALDETEDIVKAFTVGGVDYVTKPFHLGEVLARVETHLTLRNLQKQLQETNAELAKRLKELARSNAELHTRNEELDAFAHTVAHDIKRPLFLISGYAGLLLEECDTIPRKNLYNRAKSIVDGARKMNNIVENLLLLSGLRQVQIEVGTIDMAGIVAEVLANLHPMIEEYQAEIVLPERWPAALGYEPWVEEVWTNYISNAIKYGGRPPRVELGFSIPKFEIRNSKSEITFWVKDNGPGLTPEAQARLFVPFERLSQARVEGHGLGLSIVRRIVEKLGGQAGSESRLGQGSTFWFNLPA